VVIIFQAIIVRRPTVTIVESPICGGPPPFLRSIARGDKDHIPPSLSLPICHIKGIIIVDVSLLTQ
jgi:hypothetical protein